MISKLILGRFAFIEINSVKEHMELSTKGISVYLNISVSNSFIALTMESLLQLSLFHTVLGKNLNLVNVILVFW